MIALLRKANRCGYNRGLMWNKIRRVIAFVLLVIAAGLLAWASMPVKRQVMMGTLSPAEMQLESGEGGDSPAVLGSRLVGVEWPTVMRIADRYWMELDFSQLDDGLTQPEQPVGFSDAYDNYNLMAEARFEVAGIRVEPANPIRESMPRGQPLKFKWQLTAYQAGTYNGTLWLSLRFLPLDGKAPIQQPVYVQKISLTATSLFGLTAPQVRWIGGAGIVLGIALIIGDMIALFRSRKNPARKQAADEKSNHE